MKKNLFLACMFFLLLAAPSYVSAEAEVVESAIAKDVVDRSPVDSGDSFPSDVGRLWCYTKISGGEGTAITHKWYYKDTLVAAIPLQIKYPSHRTFSNKTIPSEWKGDWRVDVSKEDGTVLKTLSFTIE